MQRPVQQSHLSFQKSFAESRLQDASSTKWGTGLFALLWACMILRLAHFGHDFWNAALCLAQPQMSCKVDASAYRDAGPLERATVSQAL